MSQLVNVMPVLTTLYTVSMGQEINLRNREVINGRGKQKNVLLFFFFFDFPLIFVGLIYCTSLGLEQFFK